MTSLPSAPRPIVRNTLWRTLVTFCVTRLVIVAVLALFLLLNIKKGTVSIDLAVYWRTCASYMIAAVICAIIAIRYRRHFRWQLALQLTVDIAAISVLYTAAGGDKSGLAILYLFPLAGGAILAPLPMALFFVSVVTLFMLGEVGYQMLMQGGEPAFSQAGLYGAAYFAAVIAINQLAVRLINQEALAARRGIDLQIQQAINHLVIADMGDGILVIGRGDEILTVNPAAARMLGFSAGIGKSRGRLTENPALAPIAEAYTAWQERPTSADVFAVIKPGAGSSLEAPTQWRGRYEMGIHVKLRFANVRMEDLAQGRTVIFLQDVSEIENQAQQLKLASMGRLTASIAHEVRNPLSAISHASSLLAEEAGDASNARLFKIIGDNVTRLNRMIEDILKLSRKAQTHNRPLELKPFFAEILTEFREMHGLSSDLIHVGDMADYRIWFDPLHLREVIVNLLTNALRYASGGAASIRVEGFPTAPGRLELRVRDDGLPITPQIRAHLFEPFYTTSNKGTGLGLYLARELCLNNGAMIDYEYRTEITNKGSGELRGSFVITFAMAV